MPVLLGQIWHVLSSNDTWDVLDDIRLHFGKKRKNHQRALSSQNLKTIPTSIGNSNPTNASQSTDGVKSGKEITSPIIGTAYHAPEPGAKKFVEVGKKV